MIDFYRKGVTTFYVPSPSGLRRVTTAQLTWPNWKKIREWLGNRHDGDFQPVEYCSEDPDDCRSPYIEIEIAGQRVMHGDWIVIEGISLMILSTSDFKDYFVK